MSASTSMSTSTELPLPAGPPATPSPPPEPRDELDNLRRRLHELQTTLTERFTRQTWDEYIRLRRATRTQRT